MKNLKIIGIVINILGSLATIGIMASTTAGSDGASDVLTTLGFYVWVILPFAVLLALTFFIYRKQYSDAASTAIVFTSILVVASSVMLYWNSIFNSASSTSALVFVVVPLYSLVAIAVLYLLAWLLLRAFLPGKRV